MSAIDIMHSGLKRAFCGALDIVAVPVGYFVSTGFAMPDGDLLSFYLVRNDDGSYRLEDDGMTLPSAIASGLDLKSPAREGLLRGILADEGLHYDADLTIRSDDVDESRVGEASLRFVSALIRTRDLTLLSRENVAASFADDVRRVIATKLPAELSISDEEGMADLTGPDIVVRRNDTGLKVARIYAASADLRLMDAVVDHQTNPVDSSPVIAVVDRRKGRVTEKRFNIATNRGLPMAVLDGGDSEWTGRVLDIMSQSDPSRFRSVSH